MRNRLKDWCTQNGSPLETRTDIRAPKPPSNTALPLLRSIHLLVPAELVLEFQSFHHGPNNPERNKTVHYDEVRGFLL